jgi:hypothetical protein
MKKKKRKMQKFNVEVKIQKKKNMFKLIFLKNKNKEHK